VGGGRALADRPLLLIHGTADTIAPVSEALRLRDWSGGRAQLWLVENAGHLQAMGHPDYKQRLGQFFAGKDQR
jgi:pimeloyl-ACP methyl ester carboxylesterase